MEWSKNVQETIKTWTDSQQRMVEGITKVMLDVATPPSTNAWEFSTGLWEKGVQGFLATQADSAKLWIRGVFAVTGKADPNGELAQHLLQMTRLTTEFQEQFWQGWFTTLKRLDPIKNANWINELQPLTESWRENIQRAIKLQEEWLQSVVSS